jgi:tetratricopeptide (TPR) repeat protein
MLYDDGGYAEGAALLEPLHRDGKLDDGGEIIYGRFLYKAERTDEALAVFRALIEKLGEKPSLLRVVSEIEVERGDLDTALGHLKRLIEIEPDKFSNYVGLLLIAYGMAPPPSRPAEAVSVSEQDRTAYLEEAAKRVDPQSEEDNYIIGSVLRKAGQLERAEQYLLKAEQLDPKRRSTLLELATVYGHAGNFDEALKRVVLLYSTDPSDPSVANFDGYLLAE